MALVEDGSVNLKGKPLPKSSTGKWRAAFLIIGVETAERVAFTGIYGNLVTYLTDFMHQSTAVAARNANIWTGVSLILPFAGAFIADSCLGRYWTVFWSSLVYLLGLGLMILSPSLKSLKPPSCPETANAGPKVSPLKTGFFFAALYLIALGLGGHKPCLQAFGADQFDEYDPKEKIQKISFFNWFYFGVAIGSFLGVTVVIYIQDNVGWVAGFGCAAALMAIGFLIFVGGTMFYRHKLAAGSPLTRIFHVFVATYHKWNVDTGLEKHPTTNPPSARIKIKGQHGFGIRFRFLDTAAIPDELDAKFGRGRNWRLCSVEQVEEVKSILCVFPIWIACLTCGIVIAQVATLFTKQGSTMDRRIGSLEVPPASLLCFIGLSVSLLIPVYDRVFVPIAKKLTGNDRGLTLLQRIGTGMFIYTISMIVSALIEIKRITTAKENGLSDKPYARIPLSIFMLLPQYVLYGIAEVFAGVGMQEFFYDQMPEKLKSLGIALYLGVVGIGSILSGVIISFIQGLSCRAQTGCWISDNLNKGHLSYFYWFLAALSASNLGIFIILACLYEYRHDREKMEDEVRVPSCNV